MSVFTYAAIINAGLLILSGWIAWLVYNGKTLLILSLLLIPVLYQTPYEKSKRIEKKKENNDEVSASPEKETAAQERNDD